MEQKAEKSDPERPPTKAPEVAVDGEEDTEELGELKELLVDADGVGRVLSQAVSVSTASGDQLARALRPTIEQSLEDSTRRNPGMLADAIFPVIGPVIRKSINETFDGLVQSLQTTLEHSMSAQGWKWRFEAWRTGKSFAEVVMSHTLIYQVEAVFLIHKEGGVLLNHAMAKEGVVKDEDMVSGMLSAIQDFVGDSFDGNAHDKLQTMQVGELSVWIEDSPNLTLAAVIRGRAPVALREMLRNSLAEVEAGYSKALRAFNGDVAVFEGTEPILERCLQVEKEGGRSKGGGSPIMAYLVLGVILLCLAYFFGGRWYQSGRWSALIAELNREPGIYVTYADRGGKQITGMRDRYSRDIAAILAAHDYTTNEVRFSWEEYVSYAPALLEHRKRHKLEAPEAVQLLVQDGLLTAHGRTDEKWYERARGEAHLIPRIDGFKRLDQAGPTPLEAAIAFVTAVVLEFDDGPRLRTGQESRVKELAGHIATIIEKHPSSATIPVIRIRGDSKMQSFVTQSFTRMALAAEMVREVLQQLGVDGRHLILEQKSRPPDAGATRNQSRADKAQELVVTFKVDEVSR